MVQSVVNAFLFGALGHLEQRPPQWESHLDSRLHPRDLKTAHGAVATGVSTHVHTSQQGTRHRAARVQDPAVHGLSSKHFDK